MATIAAIISIGDRSNRRAKSVKISRMLGSVKQQDNGRLIFDSVILG
jgi:hypothetical protein